MVDDSIDGLMHNIIYDIDAQPVCRESSRRDAVSVHVSYVWPVARVLTLWSVFSLETLDIMIP